MPKVLTEEEKLRSLIRAALSFIAKLDGCTQCDTVDCSEDCPFEHQHEWRELKAKLTAAGGAEKAPN